MADEQDNGMAESVDLFGFDEIYTPPVLASPPVSEDQPEAEESAPFDETDCLFNFDELGAEADAKKVAERLDAEAILASVPELPGAEDSEASLTPAAAPQPVATAAGMAAASQPASHSTQTIEPLGPEGEVPVTVAAPGSGFSTRSPGFLILLVAVLINLGLMGFTWRVSGEMREEFSEATRSILQASQEIQTQTDEHASKLEEFRGPIIADDPQHEFTFERVRTDIEAGEYATAKKRLYALLAVADRFDAETREKIEGTANYVLAEVALKIALQAKGDLQ